MSDIILCTEERNLKFVKFTVFSHTSYHLILFKNTIFHRIP